jgi:hypothetical protein
MSVTHVVGRRCGHAYYYIDYQEYQGYPEYQGYQITMVHNARTALDYSRHFVM